MMNQGKVNKSEDHMKTKRASFRRAPQAKFERGVKFLTETRAVYAHLKQNRLMRFVNGCWHIEVDNFATGEVMLHPIAVDVSASVISGGLVRQVNAAAYAWANQHEIGFHDAGKIGAITPDAVADAIAYWRGRCWRQYEYWLGVRDAMRHTL